MDAVLAIAITLPVVSLEAPHINPSDDLAAAYIALWPGYASYLLSSVTIGLYWAHSHFSGKIIRETDHGFNLLTIAFLAAVSITPFPSRPFVEQLNGHNIRVAATVYASLLALPSVLWLLRWLYAEKFDLVDPRLTSHYLHRMTLKCTWVAAGAVGGVILCWFVDWRMGMVLLALVLLRYAFPPLTPEYKPGEEPTDELEEPDEH